VAPTVKARERSFSRKPSQPQTPFRHATLPLQKLPSQHGCPTAPQVAQVPPPAPDVSQVVPGAEQKRARAPMLVQHACPAEPHPPHE
jgi:hypothetical protein